MVRMKGYGLGVSVVRRPTGICWGLRLRQTQFFICRPVPGPAVAPYLFTAIFGGSF